jgi:hypothetical protein
VVLLALVFGLNGGPELGVGLGDGDAAVEHGEFPSERPAPASFKAWKCASLG